jgi:hypothetical protein
MGRIQVRAAGDVLSAFMDQELSARAEKVSGIFRSWKQVVGERLSAHSRVSEIEKGIVLIEADHPSWIQLLQMRQEEILGTIRRNWPELPVRGVAFRLASEGSTKPISGVDEPDDRPYEEKTALERAQSGAPPETESSAEREKSEQIISRIKDTRLKAALLRLRKGKNGIQPLAPEAQDAKIDEGPAKKL